MHFTREQLQAVQSGQPVRLREANMDMVLISAEMYERLRELTYDASPWTNEEMDRLAAEDADSLGWEGMEAYQGGDA